MRRVILAVLLTIIALHAPFRLPVLAYQMLRMHPDTYLRLSDPRLAVSNDDYWHAKDLEGRLTRMGWSVTYEADSPNYFGVTRWANRSIAINAGLSWNDRYAVLAHEGAHTLQPGRLTIEQSEIFAESVAALVTGRPFGEHARYMASLKGDALIMAVYWQEIYRVAAILRP